MSKVVVITGANSGIGLAAAKLYESNGYFVVLGCRDEKKGLSTEKEIGKRSKFLKIDMTDYESINNFYDNLKAEFDKVDIFYSNAGIMYVPFSITKEGHESTLGTNYFGSSYLTLKMLDLMKDVDNSRIIQISSIAMYFIKEMKYKGLEDETIYSPWTWYNYSNLYRTMFSFELDRKINKLKTEYKKSSAKIKNNPAITKLMNMQLSFVNDKSFRENVLKKINNHQLSSSIISFLSMLPIPRSNPPSGTVIGRSRHSLLGQTDPAASVWQCRCRFRQRARD